MADIFYQAVPNCDPLSLSSLSNAKYRKQVIYVGNFIKKSAGKEIKFSITPDVMDYWAKSGNEMLSAGVAIPMPPEHRNANNPEMKRGDVVQFERAFDSKGRDSLFVHFNFTNEEAEKSLSKADVSVFVPETWTDTGGKEYKYPIRHIAFTDYPVIPGLDPMEALVASYDPTPEKRDMSLRKLAEKRGLKIAADATDDQIEEALEAHYAEATKKAVAEATKETKPPSESPAKGEAGKPTALAASFAKLACSNRAMTIDALARDGHVTPATAAELKKQYATPESLSLSDDGEATDGFEGLAAALKLNKAIELSGGRTGAQRVDGDTDRENALTRNAKERAKSRS